MKKEITIFDIADSNLEELKKLLNKYGANDISEVVLNRISGRPQLQPIVENELYSALNAGYSNQNPAFARVYFIKSLMIKIIQEAGGVDPDKVLENIVSRYRDDFTDASFAVYYDHVLKMLTIEGLQVQPRLVTSYYRGGYTEANGGDVFKILARPEELGEKFNFKEDTVWSVIPKGKNHYVYFNMDNFYNLFNKGVTGEQMDENHSLR